MFSDAQHDRMYCQKKTRPEDEARDYEDGEVERRELRDRDGDGLGGGEDDADAPGHEDEDEEAGKKMRVPRKRKPLDINLDLIAEGCPAYIPEVIPINRPPISPLRTLIPTISEAPLSVPTTMNLPNLSPLTTPANFLHMATTPIFLRSITQTFPDPQAHTANVAEPLP